DRARLLRKRLPGGCAMTNSVSRNASRVLRDQHDGRGGVARPTRAQAEDAVRTLIRWAGDDPGREGLVGTPDRVVRSYEEFYQGYSQDAEAILRTTFEEVEGYDEMVLLKDIPFISHCEHHM